MTTPETGALPPRSSIVKLSQPDLLDLEQCNEASMELTHGRRLVSSAMRSSSCASFNPSLVYAILGIGFVPVAIFRYRMAVSNAERATPMEVMEPQQTASPAQDAPSASSSHRQSQSTNKSGQAPDTPTPAPVRTVLRESFVTAGSLVVAATAFVGLAEIAPLVLILRI
ncbi:uncharacterized protein UDID_20075 [Ustilago sp. UG-2017a]|nr:uncharacterized protein UDID_20075 [Ustilago sp. UG-2017a]